MAGLVPAIHAFLACGSKTWMPGTSPGMTEINIECSGLPFRKIVKPFQQICLTGKSLKPCQSPLAKIFCFSELTNHPRCFPVPSHRGAFRDRHKTRGGMRWTPVAPITNGLRRRTAKSCGSGSPTLESSSWMHHSRTTVAKKARSPGRSRSNRKPLRGECRAVPVNLW